MSSGVNILYVITDLEIGGVPLHLMRLATAMRDRGFRPVVCSLSGLGPVGAQLVEAGIECHTCDACCGWDVRVFRRLTRVIRRLQPKLVHSFLFHANLAAALSARRAGLPADRVICEIQTVEVERRWHLWVDHWRWRRCRWTVGNSPSVVEHLARRAGIPGERLRLVRGGIDVAPVERASPADVTEWGVPAGVPLILWVGRLDPVKGLDGLIRSFAAASAERDLRLMLVGDGPERGRLEGLAKRLEISDRVLMPGRSDKVASLLKAASVFVLPSRTEGLPNALLEAMAAGCAVVTTNVPGCWDLVENERTGLLVPYGDVQGLARALLRVLADPAEAQRLGQAAAEEVRSHWNWRATVGAYEALYLEALGGESSPGVAGERPADGGP